MKKILNTVAALILFAFAAQAQNLTQADFTGTLLPKSIGSGGTTRLPVIFRATVKNLTASTTYKYYTQAAKYTDLATTNTGAGNPLFLNPDSSKYVYTTSPGIKTAGTYGIFKTDATGSYTGWFGFVYTSNARFAAGSYVIPTITIATDTTIVAKKAMNDSLLVINFGSTATDTNGTAIWGRSNYTAKNIVLLYDNIAGTGKPLAITYVEDEGVAVSSIAKFYSDSVNAVAGRWGSIIPNVNANGIRRIEQRSLATGEVVNFTTAAAGVWPSGANTVNPTGGLTTPIIIDYTDLTVPVELSSFSAALKSGSVDLSWKTITETNNEGFDIERKELNGSYSKIGYVSGHGSTTSMHDYSFSDKTIQSKNYVYRLKQIDFDGSYKYSSEISVSNSIIKNFSLSQNYPNPFNPTTVISYRLPSESQVTLKVFNVIGAEVATLVNEKQEAGIYNIQFSMGKNQIASGVYLYQLKAGSFNQTKKMILEK